MIRLITVILFLFIIIPFPAWSHPHMFITTYYILVFDQNGLAGIRVYWCFDEMYSAMTVADFDRNKDGIFNTEEGEELVRLACESLPDYNFFTNIEIEGNPIPVKSVADFLITYESGFLNYEFFIPCMVPSERGKRFMKISPYDPEFFAGMFFSEDQPVLFENDSNFIITTSVGADPDKTIFFDMVHPETLNFTFQKKN